MATEHDNVITTFELVDRYTQKLQAIGANTDRAGKLIQRTGMNAAQQFGAELGRAQSHMTKAVTHFQRGWGMIGSAANLARGIAARIGLVAGALAGIGVAATVAGARFETALAKIEALTGKTRRQTQAWGKELLSLSGRIGESPQALAEGLYFLASAGIKDAQAMEVLTAVSKAAASGLGEARDIALLTGAAMNAYADQAMTAERAVDALIVTVREGLAEPSELASSLGRVLPVAAALGVSFEDVGAAVAAMTRKGLDASEAVTALRALMTTLIKPSKQAEETLAQVGLSTAGLRKSLAQEGLLPTLFAINDGLRRLEASGVDLEASLGAVFPNVRALVGVLNLMQGDASEVEGVFKRLRQSTGELNRVWSITERTVAHAWSRLVGALQASAIQLGLVLGQAVLPGLQTLAEGFAWLVQSNVIGQTVGKLSAMLNLQAAQSPLVTGIVYLHAAIKALPEVFRIVGSHMSQWLNYLAGWAKAAAAAFAMMFSMQMIRGAFEIGKAIAAIGAALKASAAATVTIGTVLAALAKNPMVIAAVAGAGIAGLATWALLPKMPDIKELEASLKAIPEFSNENLEAGFREFEQFRSGLAVPPIARGAAGGGGPSAAPLSPQSLLEDFSAAVGGLQKPMDDTAVNTARIADNTSKMIDFRRFALGGGPLGALGVTPVEMHRRSGEVRIRLEGGTELERVLVTQVLWELRRQGVI